MPEQLALGFRVAQFSFLLNSDYVTRIVPAFEVDLSAGSVSHEGADYSMVVLRDRLGLEPRTVPVSAGVILLEAFGERLAVLAEEMVGLITIDTEQAARIPRSWLLAFPELPYSAFHVLDEDMLWAELAPLRLSVAPEQHAPPLPDIGPAKPVSWSGKCLISQLAGTLLAFKAEQVEHVLELASLVTFPAMPPVVAGVCTHGNKAVPVVELAAGAPVGKIVLLRGEWGGVGLLVEEVLGLEKAWGADSAIEMPLFAGMKGVVSTAGGPAALISGDALLENPMPPEPFG